MCLRDFTPTARRQVNPRGGRTSGCCKEHSLAFPAQVRGRRLASWHYVTGRTIPTARGKWHNQIVDSAKVLSWALRADQTEGSTPTAISRWVNPKEMYLLSTSLVCASPQVGYLLPPHHRVTLASSRGIGHEDRRGPVPIMFEGIARQSTSAFPTGPITPASLEATTRAHWKLALSPEVERPHAMVRLGALGDGTQLLDIRLRLKGHG